MANLLYRFTMTPETRTVSSIKGSPLTYTEADTNFKLIDQDLDELKSGTAIADGAIASAKLISTAVTAGAYGSSTKVPTYTVNAKGQLTAAADTDIAFPLVANTVSVYRSNVSLTTIIPLDDTVPQNTEGTQVLTATVTPKSSTNRLLLRVKGYGSVASAGHIICAVFRDSTASAVAASAVYSGTGNVMVPIQLEDEVVAGSTSATTFTVRIGPDAANTVRMNGSTTSRFLGGSSGLQLEVIEVKA